LNIGSTEKTSQKNKDIDQNLSGNPEGANMDTTELERNWKERGYSCAIWTDVPGQEWKNFVHDADELLLLMEDHVSRQHHTSQVG
jgi:hypothetical protein